MVGGGGARLHMVAVAAAALKWALPPPEATRPQVAIIISCGLSLSLSRSLPHPPFVVMAAPLLEMSAATRDGSCSPHTSLFLA